MNAVHRRKFAVVCIPILLLLLTVGRTDWIADDRVFYGLIALFLLSQIAWWLYLSRRSKSEWYANAIRKAVEHD